MEESKPKAKQITKNKPTKKLIRLTVAIAAVALVFVVLIILGQTKASNKIGASLSRGIIFVTGHISDLFPFSLYELLLYTLIISGIVLVVLFFARLIRKRFIRALSTLLTIVLIALSVATAYYAAAGFYYSDPVVAVPVINYEADIQQLTAAAQYFMEDFNTIADTIDRDKDGNIKIPSDRALAKAMRQEYKRLEGDYSSYTPLAKPILSSWVMSQMQVAGVFFAPFGEANINRDMPSSSKPLVMLHELAHSKGVMQEDEADILAAYMAFSSDLPYVRYSGYMRWYGRILDLISIAYDLAPTAPEREELQLAYGKIYDGMDSRIRTERENNYDFWAKYTLLDDVTDAIYKVYLKVMGQKKDTASTVDNNQTVVPDIDPDSGEQKTDPDTGTPIFVIRRDLNLLQGMLMDIYDKRTQE